MREDIPEVIFFSIKEDDDYRDFKLLQIENWCYVNWDIHERNGEKVHTLLKDVFSNQECWDTEGRLQRKKVGEKLVSESILDEMDKYRIACRCCLTDEITELFHKRKERLRGQSNPNLLKYEHLVKCMGDKPLEVYWSHKIGVDNLNNNYLIKLGINSDLDGYKYGLECAIDWKQVEAVKFFWDKIKSLSQNELSEKGRDELLMKKAAYTAGDNFRICPEIFEFFLGKVDFNKYQDLLVEDFKVNNYYGSLYRTLEMSSFDKFQELFNAIRSKDEKNVSQSSYHTLLGCIVESITKCPTKKVHEGEGLFIDMLNKEKYKGYVISVLSKEMDVSIFQGELLKPLLNMECINGVKAIWDRATYKQKEKLKNSQSKIYDDVLEMINKCSIHEPSGDLSDMQPPEKPQDKSRKK